MLHNQLGHPSGQPPRVLLAKRYSSECNTNRTVTMQCVQQKQTSSSSKVSEPPETLPIDGFGWLQLVTGPHVRASLMVDEGAQKRSW